MIQNTMLCSTKESIFVRFFTKCSMLLSVASKTNTFRSCKKEHVLLIMKKKNIFGILSTKLMFCQWNWYFFSSVFCNWNDEMIFFLCFYLFLYNFIILIHVTIWKNRWNIFFFFFLNNKNKSIFFFIIIKLCWYNVNLWFILSIRNIFIIYLCDN